jgi:hypothetical protein
VDRVRHWLKRGWRRDPHHMMLVFALLYFALLSILMVTKGGWLSNEKLVIFGLLLTVLVTRSLAFLRDWFPFVLLLLGYEYLRGLAPALAGEVNIWPMIEADRFLFGGRLPTVELQRLFYDPTHLHLYDYAAFFLYTMHFVLPLGFAFFLWLHDRPLFRRFAYSLVALSYVSFVTYVIFPAMPPWMAAEQGYIPHVYKIFDQSLAAVSQSPSIPFIYAFLNPNPVAAVPSLHAAWPTLVLLFVLGRYGRRFFPLLAYPFAIWLTIVYTGHHYVVDALVGIGYAAAVYWGMTVLVALGSNAPEPATVTERSGGSERERR